MLNIDEPAECPLCMEPLEMDDINFFPCTCGYQICRFCWHRIRTDENGLCPACRKGYPECPADFKPLSEEQMHRIKNEKRQKDIQRKQKITENRKHLASVRVVQKNLVFVVGLSQRLADTEILKKQEYFGKFGKILKVVINQNTSYAGNQSHGPSASAYVTYQRAEDSLRAIQAVNNVHVDGRTLKASLGTTKYCSHFLRNSPCPKLDCMYLHELGDEAASFTKEDMQMGKHQEYEQKLLHDLLGGGSGQAHSPGTSSQNSHNAGTTAAPASATNAASSGAGASKPQASQASQDTTPVRTEQADRTLLPLVQAPQTTNGPTADIPHHTVNPPNSIAPPIDISQTRGLRENHSLNSTLQNASPQVQSIPDLLPPPVTDTRQPAGPPGRPPPNRAPARQPFPSDIANLFGGNGFLSPPNLARHIPAVPIPGIPSPHDWNEGGWSAGSDLLPVESQTDWQAAFGFTSEPKDKQNDDDLGFDPWKESSQGLADLLEKELQLTPPTKYTQPPPGFGTANHHMAFVPGARLVRPETSESKILPWVHADGPIQTRPSKEVTHGQPFPTQHTNHMPRFPVSRPAAGHSQHSPHPMHESVHLKNWQDGLRALLPNINISFGQSQGQQSFMPDISRIGGLNSAGSWAESPTGSSWAVHDPAIISIRSAQGAANSTEASSTEGEEKPHWLESLQNLTETDSPPQMPSQQTNHFFPAEHIQNRGVSWGNHLPPPGFTPSQVRPLAPNTAEPHTIAENL